DQRPETSGLARRDDLDVDAEAARHGGAALELDQPLGSARHADAAAAAEARRLPGLRLQLLVEHGAVAGQPREVVARAELADESPRLPPPGAGEGAAAGQDAHAP